MNDILTFLRDILVVILGSGASFQFVQVYNERVRQEKDVKFLATQIAVLLEGYAIECADLVSNHDIAIDSEGTSGKLIGSLPIFSQLPSSESYKFLNRDLLDEIFQLPQNRTVLEQAAYFWWNVVGDKDCCDNAYRDNTIIIGNKAFQTAKKLRATYELPEWKIKHGKWDIGKFLQKESEEITSKED